MKERKQAWISSVFLQSLHSDGINQHRFHATSQHFPISEFVANPCPCPSPLFQLSAPPPPHFNYQLSITERKQAWTSSVFLQSLHSDGINQHHSHATAQHFLISEFFTTPPPPPPSHPHTLFKLLYSVTDYQSSSLSENNEFSAFTHKFIPVHKQGSISQNKY